MAAMTNYVENKLVDQLFRGQAYTFPTTLYLALYTTTPTATAASGVEVTGGSYSRVAITGSLANWAGTQGAGTTVASTGTTGLTSNNTVLTYPAPTAAWGVVNGWGILDAASAGNMVLFGALTVPKTVNNGDAAPSFAAAALSITFS